MKTSQTMQGLTTPELITLNARKNDARHVVYLEWAGALLIAGILSRIFMTYVFDASVSDWLRDGHLQVKALWNVLMYAIPLVFFALSGGLAVAAVVYSVLNAIETNRRIFFLKREMKKCALLAGQEEADARA
ncbi:conjugal transfer protein TrbF [Enterobacter huaxiensis]|uniref:conjugal transfer protein TrbF n=1 Tax=Enterobacter huaxiensis TaxID=2494702 RepID=UPI0021D7F769|nr:conjugal transfer protein TrbF [Enterobacter huaxiensis]